MSAVWNGLIEGLGELLRFFHGILDPVPLLGVAAWGWAIVLLTFTVRLFLVPLAVKQTNSMRAMQRLQPEAKKIQARYKTDRSMMRSNPEKYRERRQKQQQETMELYREHGVNPAAGCLPLLAQMPIFIALFQLLHDNSRVPELEQAGFYIVDGLSATAGQAGIGAWVLVILLGATAFLSQRQMMASNPAASQTQQQRMLMYAMPIMFVVFSVNFPVGLLLYWVSTNLWTMLQQYVMFRNIGAQSAQRT